jgi:hypothetical protein
MHPEIEEVLNELDNHRIRFAVFCRSLSAEELQRDVPASTWKVCDFIAHLATIDGPVSEMFASVLEGRDPGIRTGDGERFDVDYWNEQRIQERRDRSVDDLLDEAAAARSALRKQLAALDEVHLSTRIKFQGDARRPASEIELRRYLKGWCKHDPMHAVDMLRAVPEKRTRLIEDWVNDPVVAGYQAMMNPQPASGGPQ